MYEHQYLIGGALSLITSLYLLSRRPKTTALKFLVLFGLVTSMWGVSSFLYRRAPSITEAAYYFRIIILTSHMGFPLYLLTVLNIREKRSLKVMFLILLPAALQASMILRDDYITNFRFFLTEYGWAYRVVRFQPSLIIAGVLFVGYLLGIFLSLLILIKKASFPFLKKKYLILLLSFISFQVFGTTLTSALIGMNLLNPAFQLGGLFQFLTFISIWYALTLKEEKIQSPIRSEDFSEVYSSFLTAFFNSLISISLGEGFFEFSKFMKKSGIEDYLSIVKNKIIFEETGDLDIFDLINRNLKFFSEGYVGHSVTDRYLRVLKVAEQKLDWKFDELVKMNEEFLKSSDLIYGLSGCRFLESISEDRSLQKLDDITACLRIYKRLLLAILSEAPESIDEIRRKFSKHHLSEALEISKYGEVSIDKVRNRAMKFSKNERISSIIDELNNAISEVFEDLLESRGNIDPLLMKLKHVLRLNKEKAEKLGIYPKLLGTLATKIPKTQIHKLYSDYLEELVEEKTRELKKAQENLLKSQRLAAIGEVAAMIGHDLRNPLQAIMYSLYLAKREIEASPNENLREIMEIMEEQVEYMNKIVSDLQYYARPIKPSIVKTDLKEIISEILLTLRIPENIEVSIEIEEVFSEFPVDPLLMKRILMNLIINAIQAMEEGGQLRIRVHKEGDQALISVQDTGVGIPEENLSKIFQPLFTTKAKGQGLGLAVCKRLVEALRGSIALTSKVGEGTTFTIKLPFKELEEARKVPASSVSKE
jgi:nitrogen-specific signal transduction histidine kinase